MRRTVDWGDGKDDLNTLMAAPETSFTFLTSGEYGHNNGNRCLRKNQDNMRKITVNKLNL